MTRQINPGQFLWGCKNDGRPLCGWLIALFLGVFITCLEARQVAAAEAQWIWSPAYEKELAPAGECYFRNTFSLDVPQHGEIQITGDDTYELYVNGRRVGSGENWKQLDVYDVTQYLISGATSWRSKPPIRKRKAPPASSPASWCSSKGAPT